VRDHSYAGLTINVVNGQVIFLGPHDASFSLDGRLPSNIDCKTLQGKIVSEQGASHLDSIDFPSCSNGLVLNIHISSGHQKDLQLDIISSTINYVPEDRWDDGCLGLASARSCTFQSEQCVQPSATRIFQTIPVTRDCWEKESGYFCNAKNLSTETCAPLRNLGCEQINSICQERTDGGCSRYLRNYRCPIKQCKDTGIICNGQSYCLDGDCVKHQKQPDADFQKAVSTLSGSLDAAKQFDQHYIFAGKAHSCRNFMLGAAYCCADDGWLVNTHLLNCNKDEKELGHAKENGLAHYIGRYEEGCVGDVCLKKIKSYCTYPTKLVRIIQEQGAEKQLHHDVGDAKDPVCSGLTVDELQKIDFSKIDFKEFYDDIAKNQSIEDQTKLNQRIQEKMKHFIDEGKSHED